MKKSALYLLGAGLLAVAGSSCSEKDIMIYEDETPAVYFEMLAADGTSLRDSLVFSFPITEEPTHQLDLRVRIIGFAADRERTINVGVNAAESTAEAGTHYDLPGSVTIPAGAYETTIPVTLRREGLKDKEVRLVVALQPNADFSLGFTRGHEAILRWGDKYIKPDNWDSTVYKDCWGEFTEKKYSIILSVCGIEELPLPSDISTLGYYNRKVREYLSENPQYEPDGTPISIPVYNGGSGGLG